MQFCFNSFKFRSILHVTTINVFMISAFMTIPECTHILYPGPSRLFFARHATSPCKKCQRAFPFSSACRLAPRGAAAVFLLSPAAFSAHKKAGHAFAQPACGHSLFVWRAHAGLAITPARKAHAHCPAALRQSAPPPPCTVHRASPAWPARRSTGRASDS